MATWGSESNLANPNPAPHWLVNFLHEFQDIVHANSPIQIELTGGTCYDSGRAFSCRKMAAGGERSATLAAILGQNVAMVPGCCQTLLLSPDRVRQWWGGRGREATEGVIPAAMEHAKSHALFLQTPHILCILKLASATEPVQV